MPRIGERFAFDLTWQEELGTEPVGGYPDVGKLNDLQLLNGLVEYVDFRDSTTGYGAKFWALFRDEFFKRIADEISRERVLLVLLYSHSHLLHYLKNIKKVVDRGY